MAWALFVEDKAQGVGSGINGLQRIDRVGDAADFDFARFHRVGVREKVRGVGLQSCFNFRISLPLTLTLSPKGRGNVRDIS